MRKRMKSFCTVILAAIMILAFSIPISEAASSNQLIIVNSKKNTLSFYENNVLVKKFDCATGKNSTPTPQRKTTIVNKIKNRPYYKNNIPGGDPRNPLGKRWMGLNMYGYGTTYGIHGNNNESSIGKNISGGCIRMHNKDIEWLFDKIKVGATVIIKSTSNSDEWIARQYGINLKKANTWYTSNGKKYYTKSNGKNATGWNTINGKVYYFDSKGVLQTGLKTISKKYYYLGNDGVRYTGWQTIKGYRYYFSSSTSPIGQALIGKKKIGNDYYSFNSYGRMDSNKKIKYSGYYYYFGSDGKMIINGAAGDYYYGSNGKLVTGKNKAVGQYYYGSNGKLVKNKAIGQYYYGSDGKMVKNKAIGQYYYGSDGKIVKNKAVGDYYYGSDGKIVKNKAVGDYYYGSDGKIVKNKAVGDYYYGSDGKIVKNQEVEGYYYGSDGKAYKDCILEIGGYTYTFDKNGKIISKVKIEEVENSNPENSNNEEVQLDLQ